MNIEQYSDTEVIQKIIAGDTALFEIIVRRNNPYLYKMGRSYNYNHEDTQDLMQETFMDAYTNLAKFENRSSLKTWIVRIMLNNCFRKKQKLSFKKEITADINDKSIPMFSNRQNTDTRQMVLNRELNFVVESALQKIPDDYRVIFSLREMNRFTVKEASEILGISEANVKVRLTRAKSMLRKEVERSYQPEEIFEFNLVYCDAMVKRVMREINNGES